MSGQGREHRSEERAKSGAPRGSEPLDLSDGVPPVPGVAASVFGDALPAAERYVARLATDGVTRGLIGPREVGRLWERHVLNSAAVAEAVPEGARVVDVGSGAGLPGIPLGLARPDLSVTLVEPMARRVEFLTEVVAELEDALDAHRWTVVRGRAEERSVVAAVGQVDVVTARAVAPLPRLAAWCRGLLRPGARLVALVGARAVAELPSVLGELRAAGMTDVEPRAVGAGLGEAATTVVVMTRGPR